MYLSSTSIKRISHIDNYIESSIPPHLLTWMLFLNLSVFSAVGSNRYIISFMGLLVSAKDFWTFFLHGHLFNVFLGGNMDQDEFLVINGFQKWKVAKIKV